LGGWIRVRGNIRIDHFISDGRIAYAYAYAVLRRERKQPKVCKVKVDGLLENRHIFRRSNEQDQ